MLFISSLRYAVSRISSVVLAAGHRGHHASGELRRLGGMLCLSVDMEANTLRAQACVCASAMSRKDIIACTCISFISSTVLVPSNPAALRPGIMRGLPEEGIMGRYGN